MNSAPMAELMKTPSRTQTVKKTRAMTTAMKDRTDKINRINSNLGSPVGKGSPHVRPTHLSAMFAIGKTDL